MFSSHPVAIPSDGEPLRELLRAVWICHPGWAVASPLTFAAPAGLVFPWREWNARIFQPTLRPLLEEAREAAKSGRAAELLACDQRAEAALPLRAAAASRKAGTKLLQSRTVPLGERVWRRYANRVAEGETPGHLAVAVAVRAAAFHLPAPLLVAAYLVLEARGAHMDDEPGGVSRMMEACLPRGTEGTAKVLVA